MIMPWSRFMDLWDAVSLLFLAYTATLLPFRLAFVPSTNADLLFPAEEALHLGEM